MDENATYPIFWVCYSSHSMRFAAALQITGNMYSIFCHQRAFSTGLQPGDYWDGLAAMERFIIDTTLDPMSVIMFRVERRLEAANVKWESQLNKLHRRASEANATQQLEAGCVAIALQRCSYKEAKRIFNNLKNG